ncbi:hypothetical protein GE253_25505, partial [Niveispirillum sp. SYP-B3756]|uniref:beta strand repeat-containing protein n=1 Tax=Niveispirillum sp. SYP-B3756 TaxID=2662178 RepID=UPI00135EF046
APTKTIATASFSADTAANGGTNTDWITKTAAQTVSGTLSANVSAGETVYVSLDNGSTWTAATTTVGQNSWSLSGQTLTGSSVMKVKVTDLAGNDGTVYSQAYVLDTLAPTTSVATAAFSADTAANGGTNSDWITKTASQTVSGTLSANLSSGETVYVSTDGGSTWTAATATVGQNSWSLSGQTLTGSNTLKVKVADTAGNDGTVYSQAYVLDTTAPTNTIATAAFSADSAANGGTNSDWITKTAAQTVSGTLSANVASGETVYVSLDGGTNWTAATTTVGQNSWSLAGQTLTGSSTLKVKVTDTAGNDSTVYSQAYVLDTTAPTTTIATAAFSADTAANGGTNTDWITKTAAQTVSGTLSANVSAGETVYVSLDNGSTWTAATTTVGQNSWSLSGQTLTGSSVMKVKVTDTAGNDGTVYSQAYVLDTLAPTTTIATAAFSADTRTAGDFITKTAAQTVSGTLSTSLSSGETVYVSLDGGTTWTAATASVGQSAWSLAGQTLTGSNTLKVKVADIAGNDGTVYSQAYVLDTTAPTVTGVTSSTADGAYKTGATISIQVSFSEAVYVPGTPSITLATGSASTRYAIYTSGSGTDTLTFSYTVHAGDNAADLDYVSTAALVASNLQDSAGNNTVLTLATPGATGSLGANKAIVLDTIAPTNTIATAAFSADTAANGGTNSDFITKTAAQTVSGTLSANLATGETVSVSLDGGTTWIAATTTTGQNTWSLSGQTLTGSNTLQVKVTDTAGNNGTVYSQAYVLDTAAPTTTIATAAFSADTVANGGTNSDFITKTAAQTVSGTLSANLAAGETVYVSTDNGSTWTAATATTGQNSWSLAGRTLTGSSTLKVKVTDTAGNDGTVYSHAYVLDTTAPTTTIATAAFSADTAANGGTNSDWITKTTSQTVSGTLSANVASGEAVYVSLDNGSTWTAATTTVGQNSWSLTGQTLTGSSVMKVKVTDTAGNDGTVYSQAYVLDTTAPTTTIATAAFSADSGTIGDFITSTANQTISGTLSANLAAGETVYVSLDDGSTWTAATTTVGQNSWSLSGQTLTGANTLKVKVADTAGNDGTVYSQAYVLDTLTPTNTIATASFSADTAANGGTNSDWITKTAAQTVSGTLSANIASGEAVYVSLDNGSTWTVATTTVGQNSWSLSGQTLTGSSVLKVKVSDTAGNDGTVYSQAYVLDTLAPTTTIATATFSADTATNGGTNSDWITKTAAQTVSGTLSANVASGETVYVSLDDGTTWTAATTTVGQNSWSLTGQ